MKLWFSHHCYSLWQLYLSSKVTSPPTVNGSMQYSQTYVNHPEWWNAFFCSISIFLMGANSLFLTFQSDLHILTCFFISSFLPPHPPHLWTKSNQPLILEVFITTAVLGARTGVVGLLQLGIDGTCDGTWRSWRHSHGFFGFWATAKHLGLISGIFWDSFLG